jgi:hypothetical protein
MLAHEVMGDTADARRPFRADAEMLERQRTKGFVGL